MTRHPRARTLTALIGGAILVVATAAPGAAVAPERFVIDETESIDGIDFCGFDSDLVITEKGGGTIQQRSGPYAYFRVDYQAVLEFTLVASGETVRIVLDQITRDARITDNGDDTITVLVAGTFHETFYAPDGTAGPRNQGRETALAIIATNGTPDIEDDDVQVSFDFLGFTGHLSRVEVCDWFSDATA